MELTQKGEMVSRLQAKAGQIGKILNNLEKYNHLLKDEKKPSDKKNLPDKRQPIKATRENIVKSTIEGKVNKEINSKNLSFENNTANGTNSKGTENKEPITSDSTESFVKLDFDLKSGESKE